MPGAVLSDEYFGFFLLSWIWIYLIPASCFYLRDLYRGGRALIAYVVALPALWRSVVVWCFAAEGRRAWLAARRAVELEEKAFEVDLQGQAAQLAAKRGIPAEHLEKHPDAMQAFVAQARQRAVRPDALKAAVDAARAAELRRPCTHKDAGIALELLQRTVVLAGRMALVGWVHKAFVYDPWAVIGVARGASTKEVERAFRAKSRSMHPDKGGDAKAFLALQEAKDVILWRSAREDEATGVNYALPKFMNNIYFVTVLLFSVIFFPLTCLCGGLVLACVMPVLYTGVHVVLLWQLLCVQYGLPVWAVVVVWALLHLLFVLPALLVSTGSKSLWSISGLWFHLGPGGFFMTTWQEAVAIGDRDDGVRPGQEVKTSTSEEPKRRKKARA